MINRILHFLKGLLKRLIKEKSIRKTIGFINFTISKKIPYFFSPLSIGLEVTTKCNLDCIMCSRQYESNKDKNLSFNDFKYVIDKFPFLERIELSGTGENFLNKDFITMLEYLKKKRIYVSVVTNFTLVSEDIARKLINAGCDFIVGSIDGATKKIYEEHREGAKFEEVINGIKRLTELKRELNKNKPKIAINCVVTAKNVHEMPSMVHLASSLSIRYLGFTQAFRWSNFPIYLNRIKGFIVDDESFIKNSEVAAKEGKKLNVKIDLLPNKRLISKCRHRPWQKIFIKLDGNIWPCCEGICEENKPFGNIFKEGFNFREIWNSKEFRALRRNVSEGKLSDYCHNSNCCIEDVLSNKDLGSNLLVRQIGKYLQSYENYEENQTLGEELGYTKNDKLLIITADDFGMCHSVNAATIEVLESGIVTSCELMPTAPGLEEAAIYCKNNPELDLGIHLILTSEFDNLRYRPISPLHKVRSLVDSDGYFWKDGWSFKTTAKIGEVYSEVIAQIEYVIKMGIKPTHFSSHMFILNCFGQNQQEFINMIMGVSKRYNLPFRMPYNKLSMKYRKEGFVILDNLIWQSYYINERRKRTYYNDVLSSLKPGVTELIIHCGNASRELKTLTLWWRRYKIDQDIFLSKNTKELIDKSEIRLINWRLLMSFQKRSLSSGKRIYA